MKDNLSFVYLFKNWYLIIKWKFYFKNGKISRYLSWAIFLIWLLYFVKRKIFINFFFLSLQLNKLFQSVQKELWIYNLNVIMLNITNVNKCKNIQLQIMNRWKFFRFFFFRQKLGIVSKKKKIFFYIFNYLCVSFKYQPSKFTQYKNAFSSNNVI